MTRHRLIKNLSHDTEGFEARRQTFQLEFGGSERGQALGGGVCRGEKPDVAGLHVAPFFKKMAFSDGEKPVEHVRRKMETVQDDLVDLAGTDHALASGRDHEHFAFDQGAGLRAAQPISCPAVQPEELPRPAGARPFLARLRADFLESKMAQGLHELAIEGSSLTDLGYNPMTEL